MTQQQIHGRWSKVGTFPRLWAARRTTVAMARQLGISVLTVLALFTSSQAVSATISQADLKRVILGNSDKAAVIKALGKPQWEFGHWTPKGQTSVQISKRPNESNYPGRDCEKYYERLWVLTYKSGVKTQPFWMVLRNGRLDHWIGPTAADERKPEAIKARYGKASRWVDIKAHGFLVHSVEVVSYPRYGVAFIRDLDAREFSAKLVAKKVPTGIEPEGQPKEYNDCKRRQQRPDRPVQVDDDL